METGGTHWTDAAGNETKICHPFMHTTQIVGPSTGGFKEFEKPALSMQRGLVDILYFHRKILFNKTLDDRVLLPCLLFVFRDGRSAI
jgi:hypothetical protein